MEDDELILNLESITTRLRHDVLGTIAAMRKNALNDSQQQLEEERAKALEMQQRLGSQITSLQALASSKSKALERQDVLLDRLLDMFLRTRQRNTARESKVRVFEGWVQYTRRIRHVRARVGYLQKLHRATTQRNVLMSWRVVAAKEAYEKKASEAMGIYQKKFETSMLKARADITELQTSLAEANQRLAREEEERAILEERLRSAFLRGVVALNNEALGVLKGGISSAAPTPQPMAVQAAAPVVAAPTVVIPPPPKVAAPQTAATPAPGMIMPRVVINPNHPLVARGRRTT